ncbi:coagulation factor IXb [Hippoglossus hippoglossus]|uniref:coagulation factor IXb n=1 Tax=Hippoglossus hippoglossus TaxID=8267 RepID=UPI00148E2ABB|nr:coagulation factor IXb [Hippoglossus hippoglossus]
MASFFLLALTAALLLEGLAAEITEENTEAVFVSQQAAHAVLHRQRRYNSGLFEEVKQANLERECKEETCSYEEAREVFENNEKTDEFWAVYIDGDQCNPNPCHNEATCQDGIGSYVCWCQSTFGGKNCEIELTKQCSVNNGGCSHFCGMQGEIPVCRCTAGYSLGPDRRTCRPTGPFSCGQVNLSPKPNPRSYVNPRSSNGTISTERSLNISDLLQDDDYNDGNMTELYESDELPVDESEPSDIPVASLVHVRSARSVSIPDPDSGVPNVTCNPLLSWGLPTLPTITAKENTDQRIVGGEEAKPGEIPWQVTLMTNPDASGKVMPFCGGSLLSESWVITAAHCLVLNDIPKKGFFVRVGEHDVDINEGPERDHKVAEKHIQPNYNLEKSSYNHDIALLKLATPVELSNQRLPICLGPKDFTEGLLRDTPSSMVSGWGKKAFNGVLARKLQRLEVPYVERTECKLSSRFQITRFMFCAGYKDENMDSCQGDSGGPHTTNYNGTWFLTGIVSWGEECAKSGKYGIYTRVSRYYGWISQTTGIRTTN